MEMQEFLKNIISSAHLEGWSYLIIVVQSLHFMEENVPGNLDCILSEAVCPAFPFYFEFQLQI